MAAAAPAIGASGGFASSFGAIMSSASSVINIGMAALSITMMIMNSRKQRPKSNTEYANEPFTARADNIPLPRAYGSVRLPTNLVWFGNYYRLKTKKKDAESRTYDMDKIK